MRTFAQPRENGSIRTLRYQGRYSLGSVGLAHLFEVSLCKILLTRFQTLAAFLRLDASERAITSMILNRVTSRKDRLSYTPKQADPALHSDWNNCQRQVVRQRCQDECVTHGENWDWQESLLVWIRKMASQETTSYHPWVAYTTKERKYRGSEH